MSAISPIEQFNEAWSLFKEGKPGVNRVTAFIDQDIAKRDAILGSEDEEAITKEVSLAIDTALEQIHSESGIATLMKEAEEINRQNSGTERHRLLGYHALLRGEEWEEIYDIALRHGVSPDDLLGALTVEGIMEMTSAQPGHWH